jgi:hypothetical protein
VKGYDGDTLWFNITEEEAEGNFKKDRPPNEGEYSRYQTSSITQQYNADSALASESTGNASKSQGSYNLEDRLPRIERQDRIKNTSRAETSNNSVIEDWDSIIHKGVRTKEMNSVGNVSAVTESSIIVTTEGARDEYNVPKDEVEGFNGSEVLLNATSDRLAQFKVKVPR